MTEAQEPSQNPKSCKVCRTARRNVLEDLDDDLLEHRRDGASLRELADVVNGRVLTSSIEKAEAEIERPFGSMTLDEMVNHIYEVLQGDDTERRARVRTRLDQAGLDVNRIREDWVTHPTVRNHLRECLGIDTSRSADITREEAVDTVEWAQTTCEHIVIQTLDRLQSAGHLSSDTYDVTVSVRLVCRECASKYEPRKLFRDDGCACEPDA
jgi:hypothetical protein